eukprot:CAMPEP_0204274516 /NCGR_PEP_ID=MMETSP0468-20130131/25230_1 /ASSEMBLY_ACC=CAM_ASM_000383 /TAXON_ID=2969 /ORGANISM="Oxyrrhis marina" /LENGTH=398 /DNA_ID=CAMNT_0051250733 /DNA_START=30 /DNA_END=1226 /DNA_ORIENTATION=+
MTMDNLYAMGSKGLEPWIDGELGEQKPSGSIAILLGPTTSGKTTEARRVVHKFRKSHDAMSIELDGSRFTNDEQVVVELSRQFAQEGELMAQRSTGINVEQCLHWVVKELEAQENRPVFIVLDSFERFCRRSMRPFLYGLFDLRHRASAPVMVLCLASSDPLELLEKRIRSRLSFKIFKFGHVDSSEHEALALKKVMPALNIRDVESLKRLPGQAGQRAAKKTKVNSGREPLNFRALLTEHRCLFRAAENSLQHISHVGHLLLLGVLMLYGRARSAVSVAKVKKELDTADRNMSLIKAVSAMATSDLNDLILKLRDGEFLTVLADDAFAAERGLTWAPIAVHPRTLKVYEKWYQECTSKKGMDAGVSNIPVTVRAWFSSFPVEMEKALQPIAAVSGMM